MKKARIHNYTAVFEPDRKLGGYTAVVPALPGCISEGETFEEAKKNIEEAASLYIETMAEIDESEEGSGFKELCLR